MTYQQIYFSRLRVRHPLIPKPNLSLAKKPARETEKGQGSNLLLTNSPVAPTDLCPQKQKAPGVHDPPGAVVCPGMTILIARFPNALDTMLAIT